MPTLKKSLLSWPGDDFKQVLKQELLSLKSGTLPLQQASTQGGYINQTQIDLTILSAADKQTEIIVRAGIFFTETVGGCNCDDDPFEAPAYCVVQLTINKTTACCGFTLVDD